MRRANDAIVGGVVLAIIAATIGAVMWAKQASFGRHEHDVIARFRDVGNARVGNAVVIRGVVGGRIQAIELAPNGWVTVRMRLDPSVQLPSEPVVLLNESSLFGDWQATVVERSAIPRDAEVQRAVAEGSRGDDVLPGAALPGIGALTTVAGQIAGDVASVAGRFDTAFDAQAARDLHGSIRDVASLAATLRGLAQTHSSDLDTLSAQLRTTVQTLNRTANSVEITARRVDSLATSDDVRQLVANFSQASVELRHAALQIRSLSMRLGETQSRADAFLTAGDSVLTKIDRGQGTLGFLVNDPTLYRRLDSVLGELQALTSDVRANPKKYVSVKLF